MDAIIVMEAKSSASMNIYCFFFSKTNCKIFSPESEESTLDSATLIT